MHVKSHYVPILKTKKAELDSLMYASPEVSSSMTPLLEFVLAIDDDATDQEALVKAQKRLEEIATAYGDKEFFFDIFYFSDVVEKFGSILIPEIALKFPKAIPVTYLSYGEPTQQLISRLCKALGNGYCIRVLESDAGRVSDDLPKLSRIYNVELDSVDIVLDLESIYGKSQSRIQIGTMNILTCMNLSPFRSVTLAASNFPSQISQVVDAGAVTLLERAEWGNWKVALNYCQQNQIRQPWFGDYSINHPDIPEGDGSWGSAPNLRYATDGHWYIAKGFGKGHPLKNKQFHGLCHALVATGLSPFGYFDGKDFSWGDGEVFAYGTGERENKTNAVTWRMIGFSHHFKKVVSQI